MKDNGLSYSNYSHRASESDLKFKKMQFIEKPPNLSNYRNVFEDKSDFSSKKAQLKQKYKRTEEDTKPTSNLSYISKNIDKFSSTVQKSAI